MKHDRLRQKHTEGAKVLNEYLPRLRDGQMALDFFMNKDEAISTAPEFGYL